METLAYNHSYAVHEAMTNLDYDFSSFHEDWRTMKTLSSVAWLGGMGVILLSGLLSVTSPVYAQLLKRGMQGEAVAEVQTLLRNRGYSIMYGVNGAGRGQFGPQTEQAVRQFQGSVGLPVDGIVGPNTLTALRSGTGGSTPQAEPSANSGLLVLGSRGDRVAEVQTLLRNWGYDIPYGVTGEMRGVFTQETLQAVRQFQSRMGLMVDGIVGPQTMAALRGGQASSSAGDKTGTTDQGNYIVVTNGNRLNVRSGPGMNYPVVRSLPDGTPLMVASLSNPNWAEIAPGQFVSTGFIRQR
ncbi:peptidoglycan-binding protein [Spirulina subsalsa FACHB-351]|uniref:Peptidoglycan-binding protein n=1 Tax=Spirulina subsalsa FACHB-351 TaxID=234711 RepID=A0ABT3KZP3_9CYAN|nr:peptidoglycan-binding protein [Spirulina subsalsa]MCW6034721.1 peptidoglycan-binding protein [Spirulina subsalsa FACHB-351]